VSLWGKLSERERGREEKCARKRKIKEIESRNTILFKIYLKISKF
jgi:hypothetical protein